MGLPTLVLVLMLAKLPVTLLFRLPVLLALLALLALSFSFELWTLLWLPVMLYRSGIHQEKN